VSSQQKARMSRSTGDVETLVLSAANRFWDNDPNRSVRTALRLWWRSHVRGRRFVQLVQEATKRTSERVSLGVVQQGVPGRREAMPYFFAILSDLVCNMRVIHRAWWGPRRRRRSGGMWASRRLVQALREQGAIYPLRLRSRALGITSQARLADCRAQLGGTIR
jgi:hypothetical protein